MDHPMHQRQICSTHLAVAIILLLLTAYPYLFNNIGCSVSAYSSEDLQIRHELIDKFDILKASDIIWSRVISTRHTAEQLLHGENSVPENDDAIPLPKHSPFRRVQFSSLGRRYNLVLGKPTHLVTEDFTITTLGADGNATKFSVKRDDIQILDGYLHGDANSRATVSLNRQNQLMTAQIKDSEGLTIIEPTYLHSSSLKSTEYPSDNRITQTSDGGSSAQSSQQLYNSTMIVYNLRDHKQFSTSANSSDTNNLFDPVALCASVNMEEYTNYTSAPQTQGLNQDLDVFKIYKDRGAKRARTKKGIEYLTEQSRDKTRCTLHLVADYLFYKAVGNGDVQTTINYLLALVNRVNQIYLPTVWDTGDERVEKFSNIGFTVQNISIHQEFTRISTGDVHYNMEGPKVWGAREFLDNFSRHSPPRHYCLAHLLTHRQFDSPVLGLAYVASTRYGTIGGICSPTQQKGDAFYKHNTGISTSKGISGETLITRQADLVVAHELGHNLGAEHDSSECRPGLSQGGAYLMHPFAVMGFERNNRFLSECSRLTIGRVIHRKASTCFVGVVDNVCGNGIVEGNEECDGGDIGHGHNDPCCDSYCRLSPGSQCSDRHSWCCSKCRIQHAGKKCKDAEEYNCQQTSYCDGRSAECPPAPPVDDGQTCVGRGMCRGGDCIPFCEAHQLLSCLCNTPANACKLCCKTSPNSTCVPYDNKAPYLHDGIPCYRGICEKGRCEQPIQDVVSRLWDVIEDINATVFVKFLRDNIIFVVIICSIPIWCVLSYYINEFDKRIKQDVISTIMKSSRSREGYAGRSPFLPRLFVDDDASTSDPANNVHDKDDSQAPKEPPFSSADQQNPSVSPARNGNRINPPHRPIGFRVPDYGFQLPEGEEVVFEPQRSIANPGLNDEATVNMVPLGYSTQV